MQGNKIIVLTPVKNEDWILERFLKVTSCFADHIIILDQNSSDNSRSIAKRFEKVILLTNESEQYDEAYRQQLLIQKAREIAPDQKRILLALDADEILAADYFLKHAWQQVLTAEKGTVLYFNKLDIYKSPMQCLDYESPWPLGYIDDGAVHQPKTVHSIRIPAPDHATKLVIDDVYILHYAMVDIERQNAKMRMYSVIEKTAKTKTFYNRRMAYRANKDWKMNFKELAVRDSWIAGWGEKGIDLRNFEKTSSYWQDLKVLQYFEKFGEKAFYSEDIWNVSWETLAAKFGCTRKITPPHLYYEYYYSIVFILNDMPRKVLKVIRSMLKVRL